MRIIGGIASGRILKVPKGFDVRPTPDLVRQAVFNSLGGRVIGARVLELFGGTGALGLECLSRGAAGVVCVEKAGRHARVIEQNVAITGLPTEEFEIWVQDAFAAVRQLETSGREFNLVLADPPYGEKNVGHRSTSFAQQLLDDPNLPGLIAREGLFLLGHTKRDTLALADAWEEVKFLKHGDSVFRFLKVRTESGRV